MYSKINTLGLNGIKCYPITVECDIRNGLNQFNIVGLASKSIQESKERVRSAIKSSGFEYPNKRVTINLAPADQNKSGSHLDLPLAVSILVATNQINFQDLENTAFFGELALNGNLNHTAGVLALVEGAKEFGFSKSIIPTINANEAGIVAGIKLFSSQNLNQLNKLVKVNNIYSKKFTSIENSYLDFDYINNGQLKALRALEIAAAGKHNLMIIGNPGIGKTFVSRQIIKLMPNPNLSEIIDITKIYSVAGKLHDNKIIETRPFRAPHHSSTYSAIIGGGLIPKPGEISLAHNGVLFLDELNLFDSKILEAIREPLEDREVVITRFNNSTAYPCDFLLIVAINPCKCGYWSSNSEKCKCTKIEIEKYQNKLSGPLMDRIDMQIYLKNESAKFQLQKISINEIKQKINTARLLQKQRYKNCGIKLNSYLPLNLFEKYLLLDHKTEELLTNVYTQKFKSIRAYIKTMQIARTIADLDNSKLIQENHLIEAFGFRFNIYK